MSTKGIYVERSIHAPLETVWRLTQEPALHERWDLRFSSIGYLPRADGEPQHFVYVTRIGFGLEIRGKGVSTGQHDTETSRTSALSFSSDSKLSLIRVGSGYWRYLASNQPLRFLTWYDYETRWGMAGKVIDRLCFRPLIGWATAWSFDCLRLWAEEEVRPEDCIRFTLVYAAARLIVVFVWAWHGLVPKLLTRQSDELYLLAAQHLPTRLVTAAGFAEIGLAILGLVAWRWRGYYVLTGGLMALALVSVACRAPQFFTHAFNPLTFNLSVAGLCLIGFVSRPVAAFAGNCRRQPPSSEGSQAA